jgi:hypothetical protein
MTYAPVTYSGSTWNIYINGTLKSTHTNCYYPCLLTRTKNYLGYDAEMYHQHYASGSIDDFRIYNRILSLADVRQLVFSKNTTIINSFLTQVLTNKIMVQASPQNFNNNILQLSGITDIFSFTNGTYTINQSSTSDGAGFNLFKYNNPTDNYWISGCKGSPSNFTQNSYNGLNPSQYQGGGSDNVNYSTNMNGTPIRGEWIEISLPYKLQLSSYAFYPLNTWERSAINKFYILGSNDKSVWYKLDLKDLNNTIPSTTILVYDINTTTSYSYFRLVISELMSGYTKVALAKWYINGYYNPT